MIEIIVLIMLMGKIGDMARRRGRSPNLFGLLLLACWFGGEVVGAVLGYILSVPGNSGNPNTLLIYGLALVGAALGGGVAILVARSLSPVEGVWREPAELPVPHSRLLGAVVGGVGGGVIGAVLVWVMYGGEQVEGNLPLVVQGFLGVGFIGALLGLISGIQKR